MKKNRHINKVAVIGSGIMGSRIACHFANIGVEVLLLDIVPFDLSEEQKKEKTVRNSIVNDALLCWCMVVLRSVNRTGSIQWIREKKLEKQNFKIKKK